MPGPSQHFPLFTWLLLEVTLAAWSLSIPYCFQHMPATPALLDTVCEDGVPSSAHLSSCPQTDELHCEEAMALSEATVARLLVLTSLEAFHGGAGARCPALSGTRVVRSCKCPWGSRTSPVLTLALPFQAHGSWQRATTPQPASPPAGDSGSFNSGVSN